MSQENIELIRSLYAAWDRGESVGHLIADEFEYVNPPNAVEPGIRRDRKALVSVRDVYPDFRVEPERFEDVGDEVLVIGTARGTSASGLETRWRQGYIWTIEGGRITRFRWFNDPAEALAAAGVSE